MTTAFRIFDKVSKKMLYTPELRNLGVFLSPDGRAVQFKNGSMVVLQAVEVLFDTGMRAQNNIDIFDSDVLDVDVITEFGSTVRARGVMQWDKLEGKWQINIPNPPALVPVGNFQVQNASIIGNTLENPELLTV